MLIGLCYLQQGMYPEAIAESQKAMALLQNEQHALFETWLAHAYAVAGQKQQALTILKNVKEVGRHTWVSPTVIAAVYAGMGEKDQAFAWLQRASNQHDPRLFILKVHPAFDPLRSDPRFAEVLRHRRLLL